MQIHWFPGHMNKARREIRDVMKKIDLVIEVLDARVPDSSSNPLVETLRGDKALIRVMTKIDLADPVITDAWIQHYKDHDPASLPLPISTRQGNAAKRIPSMARELLPERGHGDKPIRAIIMGIPNVGKSTLINTLTGKKAMKTGNEPAVTKRQQKILLDANFELMDTPGIMSPSPKSIISGYRLAASGAIRDTALEYEDVAMYLVDYLLQRYPALLQTRYKLKALPEQSYDTLAAIAAKRGCLKKGGFDLHKVSDLVVKEFREGLIGPISLEEPGVSYDYRDLPPEEPDGSLVPGDSAADHPA